MALSLWFAALTGFALFADVVTGTPAGTATVHGTLTPAWQTIVTPDLTGYPIPFFTGDVWSFTFGGPSISKTVGTDFPSQQFGRKRSLLQQLQRSPAF